MIRGVGGHVVTVAVGGASPQKTRQESTHCPNYGPGYQRCNLLAGQSTHPYLEDMEVGIECSNQL